MPTHKYLCIQRSEVGFCEQPSPAQMQQMYAVFTAWRDEFQDNIVDMGGKLARAGAVVTADGATDGPFVEAKELIGGFMVIAADSMDEAIEVVRRCPGVVSPGSSVEIREIHTP